MVRAEKGVGCIFAGSWEIGGWGVVGVKVEVRLRWCGVVQTAFGPFAARAGL
jgi:hypothetical protein